MTRSWSRWSGAERRSALPAALLMLVSVMATGPRDLEAQRYTYTKGQPLYPAYEGWVENSDGSKSMLFGYMNENWEELLDVPVGDDNHFSPGSADVGQPTHFLPRRNRFIFAVRVPDGFEQDAELIWTLRANGKEYRAYGTLRADLYVDNVIIMSETGALGAGTSSPEIRANMPPEIQLEGGMERNVRVGETLTLAAMVSDDGQPNRDAILARRNEGADDEEEGDEEEEDAEDAAAEEDAEAEDEAEEDEGPTPREQLASAIRRTTATVTVSKRTGLHFTWFVYRGPGESVEFDTPQIKPWEDTRPFANSPWALSWSVPEQPEDGRWSSEVTFSEPGTYVLRGRADDGGLYADVEVTVLVQSTVF